MTEKPCRFLHHVRIHHVNRSNGNFVMLSNRLCVIVLGFVLFFVSSHKRVNATKNIFQSFEDSGYSPGSVAGSANGGGGGRSDLLDEVDFSDPLMFGSRARLQLFAFRTCDTFIQTHHVPHCGRVQLSQQGKSATSHHPFTPTDSALTLLFRRTTTTPPHPPPTPPFNPYHPLTHGFSNRAPRGLM